MELIMYHLTEVKTKKQVEEFLRLPALLYARIEEFNWISPPYNDTKNFFNPTRNLLIKEGEARRWLLYDVNKHLIGRIAAFYWKNNPNEQFSTGYFGFFECADDKKGSELLFNAAGEWLMAKGVKTMQGPFYLGGPGFFSGSLIRGFFEPVYGVPYNPAFYNDLFLDYGFTNASNQKTYRISLTDSNQWKFVGRKAMKFYHDLRYHIETYGPKDCERFSKNFTLVFNKVWTNVPGMAPMTPQRALSRCKLLRPAFGKRNILFLYFEEEPIAFLFTIPDIHQILKKFKGKYTLLSRLRLWLAVKFFKKITTLSGLIYGIVPEHQNKDLEAFLFDTLKVLLKMNNSSYNELQLNRVGDFAPGIKTVVEQLNGEVYHEYATYQINLDEVRKKKRGHQTIS